jgi:hypothetical protein
MAIAPIFVGTPKVGVVQILPADTTTAKTLVTAGSSGTKVVSLTATSTDSTARVITVSLVRSATAYVLTTVTVPITAGTDGTTPSVNLLNTSIFPGLPVDNDGQPYLFLQSGDTLTVASTVTVTAAKAISFTSVVGDF